MDLPAIILWLLLAGLSYVLAMRYEKSFCLYLIAGFAGAAFMALISAPFMLHVLVGINTVVVSIILFEFGPTRSFLFFSVSEVLLILVGLML